MPLTTDYDEAIHILREPLWTDQLEVRPGSFNTKDKNQATKAIALVYYDWRVMEDRLDQVVGPSNWRAHLVPWGPKLICELTILGVTKESSGEEESKKENVGTSTEAQCKKRAASSHGIGRYLYFVKDVWGELNKYKNGFENPDALVQQIYRESRNLVGRSIAFPYDLTQYIGNPRRVQPGSQAKPEDQERPTSQATSQQRERTSSPISEPGPASPITDPQIKALKNCYRFLQKTPPQNMENMTYSAAQTLIEQLKTECNEKKQNEQAS